MAEKPVSVIILANGTRIHTPLAAEDLAPALGAGFYEVPDIHGNSHWVNGAQVAEITATSEPSV
jgi:hypothetical protein